MEHNNNHYDSELQEDTINWRELYERYIVYWKWVVASAVVALVLGYFYTRCQPNVYEVNSTLLVIDQSRAGGMSEMSLLKQMDILGSGNMNTMVNNENEVIKSTTLMKRVVDKLELHTQYTCTHFLKELDIYTASPLYVQLEPAALDILSDRLTLKFSPNDVGLSVSGAYLQEEFKMKISSLPAILKTPAGSVSISLRDGATLPENNIKVTISNPKDVARLLAEKALKTEVSKMVDVIKLTAKTTNAQKARDILYTLVEVYNQDAIEQVNRSAMSTALFIDDRMNLLERELGEVERQVESYKKDNKMTDIEADAALYLSRNDVFDKKRIEVETQLNLVRFVEDFIQKTENQSALIPNLGLMDVGLVQVINGYNELVMMRERIADGSSDENPTLKLLNQQILSSRQAIRESMANSRKGLEISIRDLERQNTLSQSKISNLPRQEREYVEIKRQQQVKESLYLFLLQKREEASITMAVTVPKGRILNSPDSPVQVGPRVAIIMGVFFILGIIFPLLVVFVRDVFDTTISSRSQIENRTDVPILTELGHNEGEDMFVDHKSNSDANAELFRLLRTKLQFTLDYPKEKVIMVTSTQPGEGKSFVSINLALSLAMADHKVLLMGMDLRKPQIKKIFNLDNDIKGISSYLSGHEPNYKNMIQKQDEYPTLHIIPAGAIPPNPNELLIKERLDKLLEQVREEYDYIVMDTAPLGAVSDTFLIDRVADICLYICRMNFSDKRNIDFINHIKADKSLKRPYLVLNDLRMESKYYYHRGYSYGYGKYYGDHKKK